ncbi:MAG: DUF504 domain-containing protein [Nitrososphaera sp.]
MARKGRLEEIFSMALHSDEDPRLYVVSYRDFDNVIEVPLPEFVKTSEKFTVIPPSRIIMVKRKGKILYRKHGSSHQ